MAYPAVTALPVAPARVSDPSTFLVRLLNFNAGFSTLKTQSDAFADYINAINFGFPNDWGLVTENLLRPLTITYSLFGTLPQPSDTGITFATRADDSMSKLQLLSETYADIGDLLDPIIGIGGEFDASKPNISKLTAPPVRGQAVAIFNTNHSDFINAARTQVIQCKALTDYLSTKENMFDFGLTNEAITTTVDLGVL